MGMVKVKGQVFLIIAVFVLLAMIFIRTEIKPLIVKPSNMLPENFINLKNELIKTVDLTLLNQSSLSTNLNNFIEFSTNVFNQRGYKENVTYVISTTGSTTTVNFNVSLEFENSYLNDTFSVIRTVY